MRVCIMFAFFMVWGVGSTFVVGVARDVQVHAARCSHFQGCRTHCSSLHALLQSPFIAAALIAPLLHCSSPQSLPHCVIAPALIRPTLSCSTHNTHTSRKLHTLHRLALHCQPTQCTSIRGVVGSSSPLVVDSCRHGRCVYEQVDMTKIWRTWKWTCH